MIIRKIFCAISVYFIITSFNICCKPLSTDLNDNNLVEKQVKEWQKANDDFLDKENITKSGILYNHMKNSFKVIKLNTEEFKSYKRAILDYAYTNYRNEIKDNHFFITETISQHGLSYTLFLNTEGKNLIKLNAFRGKLSLKGKENSSFLDYEKRFSNYKSFDECEVNNNPNRYTVINKFNIDEDIEIKVIDRQCRGEYK